MCHDLTSEEIVQILKDFIILKGNSRKAARALKVNQGYLSMIMKGRRPVGPQVCEALGYEKVVRYKAMK